MPRKLALQAIALVATACSATESSSTAHELATPVFDEDITQVPPGTRPPTNPCPAGTTASLPNMSIQCPFQTQTAVDKDWKISPACTLGEIGIDDDYYKFDCEGACKVTTGALVNRPPDHFPYCEPGGENAPTYKSGCENVEPPEPNEQSIKAIDRQLGAWGPDSKNCEAKRAKGCAHHFGTMADYCKNTFESAPTYVEGHMGVCCNNNAQPEPALE